MTDIKFYVSNQDGLKQRLSIVYKLIGYALKQHLFIHIHTENKQMSKKIDDWLWTYERASFLPHRLITDEILQLPEKSTENSEKTIKEAITISHQYEPFERCDYLINLSTETPSYFSRFTKFAEILDSSNEVLSAGRKRYVFYRDRGYTLAYHKL